ncbi:NrdH-like glutaredoxin [Microbacterium phage Ashton]|uniref:NrdH-like glutaredoxin n=2 Tax=Akonivirus akoni TaxID=2845587 RepID=A0A6M3SZZ5_9CAUD|nr:NrdH-like glutaredoxin [Microbacterium phage Truong]QJD51748.1 NrdH-like glutaredoxin [Microbacterium phage Ashton]
MTTPITVWTKPVCVQCNAVKRRLVEQLTHQAGLSPDQVKRDWEKLKELGRVQEFDLTAEEHEKDLLHFKGLGYVSAPITEYEGSAIPGYNPDELDKVVEKWKAAHAADPARG